VEVFGAALAAVTLAAILVEKLVERIKAAAPNIHGWLTSVLALALALVLVVAVPQVRILEALFGGADPVGDLVFTALIVAAGSGFVASVESFFHR